MAFFLSIKEHIPKAFIIFSNNSKKTNAIQFYFRVGNEKTDTSN